MIRAIFCPSSGA